MALAVGTATAATADRGEKASGRQRAPSQPVTSAAPTTAGNGRSASARAKKAATASATSQRLCRVRVPMRQAACNTTAVTAGLSPQNTAATGPTWPKRR